MKTLPNRILQHPGARRQRGAVLMVSLLILLVMTVLGVSSMQSTSLEESMAYATRDRNLALQSAEAALRAGETYIETIVSPSALGGSGGLYRFADTEPAYYATSTWDTTLGTLSHVSITPPTGSSTAQYYIKETGVMTGVQGAMNLSGYGENKGSGDITTFRVVARGTGGSATGAEVMLRSNYGREF